jgi:hypothetical protein
MSSHRAEPAFISETIDVLPGDFDPALMAIGLASPPRAFTWRGERFEITQIVSHVKQSTPEGGTENKERYLRRQVFEVQLSTGQIASIYIERDHRRGSGRNSTQRRWFLYTMTSR